MLLHHYGRKIVSDLFEFSENKQKETHKFDQRLVLWETNSIWVAKKQENDIILYCQSNSNEARPTALK